MEKFNRQIYNIILIHTARTWERIRLKQPHQEIPHDKITSTDYIEEIASIIINDELIQEFIKNKNGDIWYTKTKYAARTYIENLAEWRIMELINQNKDEKDTL